MTDGGRICALPGCDRLIEQELGDTSQRKYCGREHSMEARRLRQRARAAGELVELDDETAPDAGAPQEQPDADPAVPGPPDADPGDPGEQVPVGTGRRPRVRRAVLVAAVVVVVAAAVAAIVLLAGRPAEVAQGSASAAGTVPGPATTTGPTMAVDSAATTIAPPPASAAAAVVVPAAAPELPGRPTGLTASPGNAQAQLCWKPATGASGYTLYYHDISAGQDWVRMPYPISGTCYTSQLMVNNHTYEFKVRGGNPAGEGAFSNIAMATPVGPKPGAPTGLRAVPGNGQARLCWNPAPNADGYSLFYHDISAGQDWVRMPYPISGTCYTSQLMVNNHTYEFKVCGGNLSGEGSFSNVVAVTPKP
jgi:hypothetical protein